MNSPLRHPWLQCVSFTQEDEALKELVLEYGDKQWTLVSAKLRSNYNIKHRNAKQCRERWCNHLDPFIRDKDWTEHDEAKLFELHTTYGNTWAEIAKHLPGRTDNCIKNHFYSTVRRNLKEYNQKHTPLTGTLKVLLRNPEISSILLKPNFKVSNRPKVDFSTVRKSSRTRRSINYEICSSDEEEEPQFIGKTKPKPFPIDCSTPVHQKPVDLSVPHSLYSLSPVRLTENSPQYFVFPDVFEEPTPRSCAWAYNLCSPLHLSPRQVS